MEHTLSKAERDELRRVAQAGAAGAKIDGHLAIVLVTAGLVTRASRGDGTVEATLAGRTYVRQLDADGEAMEGRR